jgi:hypothetical protein
MLMGRRQDPQMGTWMEPGLSCLSKVVVCWLFIAALR